MIRKISFACIVVFVVLVFVFNTGSSRPFEDVAASLESELDKEKLQSSGNAGFKRYYGLEPTDYDGILFYTSTHPMSAEEVLVVRAESKDQMSEIEDAVNRRIEDKLTEFGTYAPEQTALIENAVVAERGQYVFFAVSADADSYRKAFMQGL